MNSTLIQIHLHDVYKVWLSHQTEPSTVLVFKTQEQDRYLPIYVESDAGYSIAVWFRGYKQPQPNKFELMAQKFKEGNSELEAVHIVDSNVGHWWTIIQFRENNDLHPSCSETSVSLTLAVHLNAPIFIEADLLNALGSSDPMMMNQTVKLAQPFELNRKD